jgi:hypothetical protein
MVEDMVEDVDDQLPMIVNLIGKNKDERMLVNSLDEGSCDFT